MLRSTKINFFKSCPEAMIPNVMSRLLSIRVTEIAVLTSNPLGKRNDDNSSGGNLYQQEDSIIPWCKTII